MKKLATVLLALLACLCFFAGCGGSKSDEKSLLSLSASDTSAEFVIDENEHTATASIEATELPSITLTATVSEKATYKVYADEDKETELSMPWTLAVGVNTAYLAVTAENGSTVAYTVSITFTQIPKSSAKELLSISAVNKDIPAFTKTESEYSATLTVLNKIGTTGLTVSVSPKAMYKIYTSAEKTTELSMPWTLAAGENKAFVVVTAEDGTTADYTVKIIVSYTQRTDDTAMTEVRGEASDYSNYDTVKAAILALAYDNGSATYYENIVAEQAKLTPVSFERYTQGELNARYNTALVSNATRATEIIEGLGENSLKSEYEAGLTDLKTLVKYADISSNVRYNGTYEGKDAVVINRDNGNAEWNRSGYSQISMTGDAAIALTVKQTANGGGNHGNICIRFVSNKGLTLARWMIGLRQVNESDEQIAYSWSDMYITKNDAQEENQFTNLDTDNRLQATNAVTLIMVRKIEDGIAKFIVYGYQEEGKLVFTNSYDSTYDDDGFFFIGADDNNISAYNINLYGTISTQPFGNFDKKEKGWDHFDSYTFNTVLKGDFAAEITVNNYQRGHNGWNVVCFPFINNKTGVIESIMMAKWEGVASKVFVFEPWLAGGGNKEFDHHYGDLSDANEDTFKFIVKRTDKTVKVSMLKKVGEGWETLFREVEVSNNYTKDDIIVGLGGERYAANITVVDKTTEGVDVPYIVRTVTFNANGGAINESVTNTATTKAADGKLAALLANTDVTRAGYTLAGWYTEATDGTEVTTDTVFENNATVYARWTRNSDPFTITFDANGGTFGAGVETTKNTSTGDKLDTLIAGENVTNEGYRFHGWFMEAEGGTQVTTDTVFTDNATVYAHWVLDHYDQRTEETAMEEVRGIASDYSNYNEVKAAILALDYGDGSITYYESVLAEQAKLTRVAFNKFTKGELNVRYNSALVSNATKATEIIDAIPEDALKSEYEAGITELNKLLKYADISSNVRYNGKYEGKDAVVISGNAGDGTAEYNKSGYSQISMSGNAVIVLTVKQTANSNGGVGNVVIRFVNNNGLTLARWMIGLRQVNGEGTQIAHSWSDMYITKNNEEGADQFTNLDTQGRLQAAHPITLIMVRTIENGKAVYTVYGYQEEENLVFTGTYESTYTDDGFFFVAADSNNLVAYDINLYGTISTQPFGNFDKTEKGWQHYDSYTFDTIFKGDFTAEIIVSDYQRGGTGWNVICFPFINYKTGVIESIMMPKWEGVGSRVFAFEPWLAKTGTKEFDHHYGDLSDTNEDSFKFVVKRVGKVIKVSMLKKVGDDWETLFREYEVTNNFTEDDIIIGLGGEKYSANVTVVDKTTEGVEVPYIVRTVTFDANSGTINESVATTATTKATDGKLTALIASTDVTREGYTFDGWYTEAEGGTQVTTDTVFENNATIYAHWTAVESGSDA